MKFLEDLVKSANKLSLSGLIETELKDNKEPVKTQKKQIITK